LKAKKLLRNILPKVHRCLKKSVSLQNIDRPARAQKIVMRKNKNPVRMRISKGWISAFTANILGVIIGIALTFGVSELVQQCSDRKQVKEMLVLIEDEISANRTWLEARVHFYQKDKDACQIILAAGKRDTIPSDTLKEHIKWMCSYEDTYAGTKNWDAFRNSGMVQKLHNPEIVSYLTHFYFLVEKYSAIWDDYCQKREVVRNTLFSEIESDTTVHLCLKIIHQSKECVSFMKLTSVLQNDESIENNYSFVNIVFNAVRQLTKSENFTKEYFNLAAKAHTLYQQKDFLNSGLTYSEAFRANGNRGLKDDYYNAACSWALANEPDSAFFMLEKSVIAGYSSYSWILQDADLQSLRDDMRWKPLLEKISQKQ
jgi:hypothetical protein